MADIDGSEAAAAAEQHRRADEEGDSQYDDDTSDALAQTGNGIGNRPSFRQSDDGSAAAASGVDVFYDEETGEPMHASGGLGGRRKSSMSQGAATGKNSFRNGENSSNNGGANFGENYEDYDQQQQHHQQMMQEHVVLPCNVAPPRPMPTDPIVGAFQQFPVTFLRYSEQEAVTVPVGAADPFLPRRLAEQRTSLAEAPVVTGSVDVVLDALLPPRRTTVTYRDEETGARETVDVVQRVAHSQIKRDELRRLRYDLDVKLAESRARSEGICSVRRSLHALLFDELIRQVTIDCPERGILLRRVRDEIQMSLDAHHALYEESVSYSTNRCVAAAKHTPAMTQMIEQLNREIAELRKEQRKLQAKQSAMARAVAEQEASDRKRHEEEKTFLERTKQRLEDQYRAVIEAQEAQKRAMREAASLG